MINNNDFPPYGTIVYLKENGQEVVGTVLDVEKYVGEGWWRCVIESSSSVNSRDVQKQLDGTWIGRNPLDFKYPDRDGVLKNL